MSAEVVFVSNEGRNSKICEISTPNHVNYINKLLSEIDRKMTIKNKYPDGLDPAYYIKLCRDSKIFKVYFRMTEFRKYDSYVELNDRRANVTFDEISDIRRMFMSGRCQVIASGGANIEAGLCQ